MPNTRATRRLVPQRRLNRKEHPAMSDDDSVNNSIQHSREDVEAEPEMSVMDYLRGVKSGVEELNTRIRFLEQENRNLRSELQQVQQNMHNRARGGSFDSREKASRRQIHLLERTIVVLKAAREKDRRTIERLRKTGVQRDAKELADVHDRTINQETVDLGESAIKLLRRVCDTIDMNTLAEGEECAVCMDEMAVDKCYSLTCQHPVCVGCFERLGDGSDAMPNHQTESVRCPHCRRVFLREDCEIITHTAVQQWDLLLDISRQWTTMDVGEMDIGEEDDGSVAATESPCVTETLEEAADLDPEISTASTSPNDTGLVAYKNLPSPLKRKRLSELVAQRVVKQRI